MTKKCQYIHEYIIFANSFTITFYLQIYSRLLRRARFRAQKFLRFFAPSRFQEGAFDKENTWWTKKQIHLVNVLTTGARIAICSKLQHRWHIVLAHLLKMSLNKRPFVLIKLKNRFICNSRRSVTMIFVLILFLIVWIQP